MTLLDRLIAASINRAGPVVVLAGLLLAGAGVALSRTPVDVFPELNAPTVVLLTEAGGLSAEEVELRVSFPIESAMSSLPGVRRVRSASAMGLSLVWVEMDWGTDIYHARQLVSERLGPVREQLPETAHVEIAPVTSITGEIMMISLSSPTGAVDPLRLRGLAEFEVRPRLLAVPGVAQVVAIGGRLPELQVHVRPDELLLSGVTFEEVRAALAGAHSTRPGGYLEDVAGEERPIQQQAEVRRPEDIASTRVTRFGDRAVRLGEVAEVGLGGAPRRGTAADRGQDAVVLSIQKAPGTNTLALTETVDRALDDIEAALPPGVALNRHAFRQAAFIQRAVDGVSTVTRDAAIIVAVVLMLFLMNVRATLITLTALPLSLAVAAVALKALGLSINVMTLGGLAVAIGELVDDAIIDVENVIKRLRERPEGVSPLKIVFEASREIRSSVVFATVVIALCFVPLLLLSGLEGRFFRPLGIAYIVAIAGSLAVALTVTPALCRLLLSRGRLAEAREGWLSRKLKALYRPTIAWVLRFRRAVVAGAAGMTVAALLLATTFGTSFLPQFNEGSLTVFLIAPPGTSLEESDRLARGIERRIAEIEGVRSVVRRSGRAERDEHAEPVWSSELEVALDPEADTRTLRRRLDEVLEAVPGITTMVGQPIEHRLSHVLSGTPAGLAINVFGEDVEVLQQAAREVAAALRGVSGARDVSTQEIRMTTLPIRYDRDALARYGLTPAAAAHQVGAAYHGEVTGVVREGSRSYDLLLRLDPEVRRTPADVSQLILRGEEGQLARLEDVARVEPDASPYVITRENARRKAVVAANVAEGYNLGHVVDAARVAVAPIAERYDVTLQFGGQFEAERSARRTLLWSGGAVVVLVLLLLTMALGSARAAALVLVNLPLGLIGGIAAIYLTADANPIGNTLALVGLSDHRYVAPVMSVASLVGFVTLLGIAVRNGILLVNHVQAIGRAGAPVEEAVARGAEGRLIPILMTALTAVLGLVPLAAAAGEPGSELLAPLAVVVLGGLVSSTLLNLVVVPAGYALLFASQGRREAPKKERLVFRGDTAVVEPR